MGNPFGIELDDETLRWAAAEGVSEAVPRTTARNRGHIRTETYAVLIFQCPYRLPRFGRRRA